MVAEESVTTRKFTADEVWRMVDAGVLSPDERVELLDGELLVVSPQGPKHSMTLLKVDALLREAYAGTGHPRPQLPMTAGTHSIPEPDLAMVVGEIDDYGERHPEGKDCLLVVEISMTSRRIDRRKAAIYAAAGVAEYWLVDLIERKVCVFTAPGPRGYGSEVQLSGTDVVQVPGTGTSWPASALLGE